MTIGTFCLYFASNSNVGYTSKFGCRISSACVVTKENSNVSFAQLFLSQLSCSFQGIIVGWPFFTFQIFVIFVAPLQFNFAAQGIMAIMDLGMCQSSSYLLFSLLLGSMLGQESIIKEELVF